MNKIIRNVIAILHGWIIKLLSLLKSNCILGKRFRCFKGSTLRLYRGSLCEIGQNVKVDKDTTISVLKKAKLSIGDNVSIGPNSMIICHDKISIGANTMLGPGIHIYDHDHIFSKENGVEKNKYTYGDIIIGNECWIGAGCIILKGTTIGDRCIIGAGTILKGVYPEKSLITNSRNNVIEPLR